MSNRVADRALRLCAAAAVIAALADCQTPPQQGQQRIATAAAPTSGSSGETEDRTTHPPTAKTYTSIHSLNLRTGPNHRFAAKTVLPVGTVVTPNGFVSGGWWQVDTPNFGTGWVDSTGLKPNA